MAHREQITALNGLRGVAIVLVMLFHIGGTATDRFEWLFGWGWVGVDLFFALSGFLITRILLATVREPHYFQNFYARRTLRIFPLYYGVLLAITVLLPLAHRAPIAGNSDTIWVWSYLTNLRVAWVGRWIESPWPFRFDHLWSLAVEEQFYLVWPAIVFLLAPRGLVRACALAIGAAFLFRTYLSYTAPHYSATYVHTLSRVDVLCWGGLLAIAENSRAGAAAWRSVSIKVCVAVGFSLVGLAIWRGTSLHDPWILRIALTLTGPGSAALLCLMITDRARWAEWRPLCWLGRYSYGLYLFHFLALGWIDQRAARMIPRLSGDHQLAGTALFVVLASAIPMGCAFVSYHLYEKQFLKLKVRFENRGAPVTVAR